jgi:hypothetical protein
VKAPSEENGLSGVVDMRKMAAIEAHDRIVVVILQVLGKFGPAGGPAADQGVRPTLFR